MVINNAGNVGIGTATPAAKLDVNGSIFTRGYNHIECASLAMNETTRSRLVSNGTGYIGFTDSNTDGALFISNYNIFEIYNSAPYYGLRIKKSGYLKIDLVQDIITGSGGYVYINILQNGIRRGLHLIRNTNGNWDSLVGSNILRIAENDIITFSIEGATITSIDGNLWSYYNFMFWSN
jgi:hypothetical protein